MSTCVLSNNALERRFIEGYLILGCVTSEVFLCVRETLLDWQTVNTDMWAMIVTCDITHEQVYKLSGMIL